MDVFPRTKFIKFFECFICNSICKNMKQILYKYDRFPQKSIKHCNNLDCHLIAIKRYLVDIKNNNIYPFCEINNKFFDDNLKIININKIEIESLRKYKKDWYIKIQNLSLFMEYTKLMNVNNLVDYGLFNWFLDRNPVKNLIK